MWCLFINLVLVILLIANYHPISLNCVIGKVLESIIRDNTILHHLTVNGLTACISQQQYGFLSHHSCISRSQLLTALNDWTMRPYKRDIVILKCFVV